MEIKVIKKLKKASLAAILVTIITIICPGTLILYTCKYDVFSSASNMKLLFLAGSFTIPAFCLNLTLFGYWYSKAKDLKHYYEKVGLRASALTTPIFYFPLIVNAILKFHNKNNCPVKPAITFPQAMYIITGVEVVVFIIFAVCLALPRISTWRLSRNEVIKVSK